MPERRFSSTALAVAGVGLLVFATRGPDAASAATSATATRQILVTSRSLAAGSVIQATDVVQRTVTEGTDGLPESVRPSEVIGRRLLISLPTTHAIDPTEVSTSASTDTQVLITLSLEGQFLPPALAPSDQISVVALNASGVAAIVASARTVEVRDLSDRGRDGSALVAITLSCDPAAALAISTHQLASHPLRLLMATAAH